MRHMSKVCPTCLEGTIPTGEDLRSLRTTAGMTQAAFSSSCGWSVAHQSDMERGNRTITARNWIKALLASGKDS